jgi:hypothetical protein
MAIFYAAAEAPAPNKDSAIDDSAPVYVLSSFSLSSQMQS